MDHGPPKIVKVTFTFPEFVLINHKLVYPISFLLRCSQFKSSVTRMAGSEISEFGGNSFGYCNLDLMVTIQRENEKIIWKK